MEIHLDKPDDFQDSGRYRHSSRQFEASFMTFVDIETMMKASNLLKNVLNFNFLGYLYDYHNLTVILSNLIL